LSLKGFQRFTDAWSGCDSLRTSAFRFHPPRTDRFGEHLRVIGQHAGSVVGACKASPPSFSLSHDTPTELWSRKGVIVAEFHAMEEKGSDVNLAAHLLDDIWNEQLDAVAVISNDTHLVVFHRADA